MQALGVVIGRRGDREAWVCDCCEAANLSFFFFFFFYACVVVDEVRKLTSLYFNNNTLSAHSHAPTSGTGFSSTLTVPE